MSQLARWQQLVAQDGEKEFEGFYAIDGEPPVWRCSWCQLGLDFNTERAALHAKHARQNPGCRALQKRKGSSFVSASLSQLENKELININTSTPMGSCIDMLIDQHSSKYPEDLEILPPPVELHCRSMYINREATFSNSPIRGALGPQLCQAGFFYDHEKNVVRCFWCKGAFSRETCWEMGKNRRLSTLDIMNEHARGYICCGYLTLWFGFKAVCEIFNNFTLVQGERVLAGIDAKSSLYDINIRRRLYRISPQDAEYAQDESDNNASAHVTVEAAPRANVGIDGGAVNSMMSSDERELIMGMNCVTCGEAKAEWFVLTTNDFHQCKICTDCCQNIQKNRICTARIHELEMENDIVVRVVRLVNGSHATLTEVVNGQNRVRHHFAVPQ